jgi:hypothetical protein
MGEGVRQRRVHFGTSRLPLSTACATDWGPFSRQKPRAPTGRASFGLSVDSLSTRAAVPPSLIPSLPHGAAPLARRGARVAVVGDGAPARGTRRRPRACPLVDSNDRPRRRRLLPRDPATSRVRPVSFPLLSEVAPGAGRRRGRAEPGSLRRAVRRGGRRSRRGGPGVAPHPVAPWPHPLPARRARDSPRPKGGRS